MCIGKNVALKLRYMSQKCIFESVHSSIFPVIFGHHM